MRLGFGPHVTYSLAAAPLPTMDRVRDLVRKNSETAFQAPLTQQQFDIGVKHVAVVRTEQLPDELIEACHPNYLVNFGAYAFTPRLGFKYINSCVPYDPEQDQAAGTQYTTAFPLITELAAPGSYLYVTTEDLLALPAEIRKLAGLGIGFLNLTRPDHRSPMSIADLANAVTSCSLQLTARPPLAPRSFC